MSGVVEEINDKHLGPWAELCQTDRTENTPLTPYMDEELLHYNHLNVSNEKLKNTGYNLRVPIMTTGKIEEVSYWISMLYAVCILQFHSFADNQRFHRTEITAKIDDALMFPENLSCRYIKSQEVKKNKKKMNCNWKKSMNKKYVQPELL